MKGNGPRTLLLRDLHMFIQTLLRSDSCSCYDTLYSLAKQCFLKTCPLVCQRIFCQSLAICAYKWETPVKSEEIISLITANVPISFLLNKLGIESCTRVDHMPLVLFGGLLGALPLGKIDITDFFHVPKVFLASSNPDVLAECIDVLCIYIKKRFLHGDTDQASEREVDLLKTACLCLLPHWDSDDSRADMIKHFFAKIFQLMFASNCFPESFVDWVSTDLIEKCILGSPHCMVKPVIPSKGSIMLTGALVAHAPLSWIFEKSPFLMTSLLLALAWNYCAPCAGDVIVEIILRCQSNVDNWLEYVLDPLANFLLHGILSCPTKEQLRNLPETDVNAATRLRLENFILHCYKPPLANLPLGDLYHDLWYSTQRQGITLIEELVHKLLFLLDMASPHTAHLFDFRLTVFVTLLPLLHFNVAIQITEDYPNLIEVALRHSNDRIRAEMCKTIVQLIVKTPSSGTTRRILYQWVFEGVMSLTMSADPAARKMGIFYFFEMTLYLRSRCVNCSDEDIKALVIHQEFRLNSYSGSPESVFDQTEISCLQALGEAYHFAASLWRCYATTLEVSFDVFTSDLTPFLKEMLFQPAFPPGIPYQRQKMLMMLISSMFELSSIESTKQKSVKRFGFEPCTTINLQHILNSIMEISGFPSLNESSTWLQLLASLTNVNSEIQTDLLEILTAYWPQPSPQWMTPSVYTDLLLLAETWSDFHLPEVYNAGATLYEWLFSSIYDLNAANHLASGLLTKIADLCNSVNTSTGILSDMEIDSVMQRIVQRPSLGFLAATDRIFSWHVKRPCVKEQFQQLFFENPQVSACINRLGSLLSPQLAESCLRISNACLAMMGCPCLCLENDEFGLSYLVAGCDASSFETLGQAILGLTLQAHEKRLDGDVKGFVDSDSCPPVELPHDYQHALSWSWSSLRMVSSILVKWAYFRVSSVFLFNRPLDEASLRYLMLIGKQLIGILMTCRHTGVVEFAYQSLRDYLVISEYVSRYASLKREQASLALEMRAKLIEPDEVIQVCLLAINKAKFSVTRRAAGLWPAAKAALMAQLIVSPHDQPLLRRWLCALFELGSVNAGAPELTDPTKHDPPQALVLHLIKGVFEDAQLGPKAFASSPPAGSDDWLSALLCELALPHFTANEWTVTNASFQFFTALVKRLIGPLHTRSEVTVAEVLSRYPALFNAVVSTLSRDTVIKRLDRNPAVPLLNLLSRLSPSPDAIFSKENKAKMRDCLRPYLCHRIAKIRHMAGKAFVTFFTPSTTPFTDAVHLASLSRLGCVFRKVHKADKTYPCASDSNAISGQLFAIQAWLRHSPTSDQATERAKCIDWFAAVRLTIKWIEAKHWYLASQMVRILRYVFTYVPVVEKLRYHKEFHNLFIYHQRRDYPVDLLHETLFPLFQLEFYDLCHTVDDFKGHLSMYHSTILTAPSSHLDPNLLIPFLSSIKRGNPPNLGEIVLSETLCPTVLRLALDKCVLMCKDEATVIGCLDKLTTLPLLETQEYSLLPRILHAIAFPITQLRDDQTRLKYTAWWVEHLELCLSMAWSNEHSRLKASRALFVWLNSSKQTPSAGFLGFQLASILRLLFRGLFDDSAHVRQVTGRCVASLFDLKYPVYPLRGAQLLLFGLPVLLSEPVDWLMEFLQSQFDSIVNWAATLHEHRETNACYHPSEVNLYFDMQLVLDLLFSALKHYNANGGVLSEKASSTLSTLNMYLTTVDNLRSAVIYLGSAGVYQVTLAKSRASQL